MTEAANETLDPKTTHNLRLVVKRTGKLVPFNLNRIERAIRGAFSEILNSGDHTLSITSFNLNEAVNRVADRVIEDIERTRSKQDNISVEEIQDLVELQLMESGFYTVAKAYIRYRQEHKIIREGSAQSLKVKRRDGKLVRFNLIKIARAIENAFRSQNRIIGESPKFIVDAVNEVTRNVTETCLTHVASMEPSASKELEIEWIQDQVEFALMKLGWHEVAKSYILYRFERLQARSEEHEIEIEKTTNDPDSKIESIGNQIELKDGILYESELRARISLAAKDLSKVSVKLVLKEAWRQFFPGMSRDEAEKGLVMAARSYIEKHPEYSLLTARLLLDSIYVEAGVKINDDTNDLKSAHQKYFKKYIHEAIELGLLGEKLSEFNLDKISSAIDINRDRNFSYLGLQTLYDRYLIHSEGQRIETPQSFWMRVAMGLSLNESDKEDKAIEFYDLLSSMDFVSSTPTLFNSGTRHSQMSSCYLTTINDDLHHIFKCIADDAQLSKWAGGLGNDWTNIRATGSPIKGTNGTSQGIIPFLKVANDTAVAVNQGGKRKGAMCAYLESWHLDIEEFLELRKNTGDERRRTHDMNTANWIPDLFMKRVQQEASWTLFSPSDVPDLHDLYGKEFEDAYLKYEEKAAKGEIKLFKRIEAVGLWRKMLSMLFETGHPWITFKDPSNIRSPQDHVGVVHSSNLCTEILLNTSDTETAVCNLGSINLASHITAQQLDLTKLEQTIKTAVRMLDNVIDLNFYPTNEARVSNLKHRPIGLGIMGFQDALYELGISYSSAEAIEFADNSMEAISYFALIASSKLANERGSYESFKGSKWDRGILPIDSIDLLENERGAEYVQMDKSSKLDWSLVRKHIKTHGLRNSNTLAIAPTATISNIAGVSQSIEPMYKHLFSKSNLSGEFIVHNPYLVSTLEKMDLWDDEMIDDLKYFDGSITEIERIPDEVKQIYLTAFEIEPEWLIECASRRQKWIDMGQSLNLYINAPSGKRLNEMYMLAWEKGLKTTYYLRATAATQIEKSTTDVNRRGLQPRWMKNKSASSEIVIQRTTTTETESLSIPVAECNLDGDCESCQ